MLQVGKSDQVRRQSGSRCTEAGLVSESKMDDNLKPRESCCASAMGKRARVVSANSIRIDSGIGFIGFFLSRASLPLHVPVSH